MSDCDSDNTVNCDAKKELFKKLLNGILKNAGKDPIEEIEEFKMDKDDLSTENNKDTILDNYKEIREIFPGAKKLLLKESPHWIVNILKECAKGYGYEMKKEKGNDSIIYEGKKYNRTVYIYYFIAE